MNIFEYVRGVKTFKKIELIAQLNNVSVAADDLFANIQRLEANKVNLDQDISQWALTRGIVRGLEQSGYRNGLVPATKNGCLVIAALAPALKKMIQGYREEVWDGKLLTLRQANILNLIEHTAHWVQYSNMVYSVLLDLHMKKAQTGDSLMSKADLKFINGTVDFYKSVTISLLRGARVLIAELEGLSDVEISETSLAVLEGTGCGQIDLTKRGFGVHNLNPVFWYGLVKMNLNVARIEKLRANNELFAAKISQAINLKNGTNDADLDLRIEEYQDEIIKATETIESIERQYA